MAPATVHGLPQPDTMSRPTRPSRLPIQPQLPRRQFLRSAPPLLALPWLAGCRKGAVAAQPAPAPQPRLGINLSEAVDWNTEFPFLDLFRTSREWISQKPNSDWGKGPPLKLDEAGWVQFLEPGHWADTPMSSASGGLHPAGSYQVVYDGDGEIDFWSGATVVSRAPGRLVIDVKPSQGPIWLRLKKTDPARPVRNIRVLRPGVDPAAVAANAFDPAFLKRWQGIACVRFMDWMHTNNSKQSAWKNRPKPEEATFAVKGVALEVMCDLANRLQSDAWFCIPHRADEDYVRQFATLAKAKLDPGLKVWLEFSNELWNGQFEQAREAQAAAKSAGQSLAQWVSQRSVQLFEQWAQAFGGRERLVRVMPAQAAGTYYSEELLKHRDAFKQVDALAIAPYLSLNLAPDASAGPGPTAPEVENWSVEQLLDHLESKALPECIGWMTQQKKVADRFGVRLVAYEGGQHLVGIFGAENRDRLTRLLLAANAHPRMGQLYDKYFQAWAAAGGDLHCHFNSVAQWSKWGSWGLMQHAGEDPATSPKYRAAMGWAKQRGQKVALE
jgi:hypothetical protein